MKVCRQILVPALTGLLIFLFTTLPLCAAEADNQDPTTSTMGIFFRWLNFAIVFGGIAFLISKYGGAFFDENAKSIASKITEASAAKASADTELHTVESKIANLDRDIAAMREDASREEKIEAARLRESAKMEIEKINQAAQAELFAAERAARQELQAIAASLAVQRAGVLVNSRMTPEIRARLFRSFLAEIGRSKN